MRNDLKVKAIFRKNGIALAKWTKNRLAPRMIEKGVDVSQAYGIVLVYLNGACEDALKGFLADQNFDGEIRFYA